MHQMCLHLKSILLRGKAVIVCQDNRIGKNMVCVLFGRIVEGGHFRDPQIVYLGLPYFDMKIF